MFHVYVLRSMKTGRYYVGSCQDLDDRIRRHNAGHSKATRHGIPWFLREKGKFLDSDRSREKRALFQDGARPRRTCRVEFVERSPRRQVVGSNPAGPKFCFAPEHKLSVCAPSEVLLRLTPHNLQRTACPLGAQAGRPVFRHAPKLRFFSARGSVRTSCSAQELSDCRT